MLKEFIDTYIEYKKGSLYWKALPPYTRRTKIGNEAGYVRYNKYRMLKIHGKQYRVHRLIWFMHHGSFPPEGMDIDHINRNGLDNRIENLRLATRSQNNVNSSPRRKKTSGLPTGIFISKSGKYYAVAGKDGKLYYSKRTYVMKEAQEWRNRFMTKHFGEFF